MQVLHILVDCKVPYLRFRCSAWFVSSYAAARGVRRSRGKFVSSLEAPVGFCSFSVVMGGKVHCSDGAGSLR